jgi:predicted nucleic acid-binding protein
MTDEIFFDTDCLSSFLCVNQEAILIKLYSGKIKIPRHVYDELCQPNQINFINKINSMIQDGHASIVDLLFSTSEAKTYFMLTKNPPSGFKIIGKGEAAALALAITFSGTLASNNYSDIGQYLDSYGLKNLSTTHILFEAYTKTLITEDGGNFIWRNMQNRKRLLPYTSFSEALKVR